MPFTLIHAFSGYLFSIPFTKNERLRWLCFFGAMSPDIDGFPLVIDTILKTDYYHLIHRALFHPLIAGAVFSFIVALLAKKYLKLNKLEAFGFFFFGFILHNLFDALFTNWPVKLFYPLSNTAYAYPILLDYIWPMYFIVTILFIIAVALNRKAVSKELNSLLNYFLTRI